MTTPTASTTKKATAAPRRPAGTSATGAAVKGAAEPASGRKTLEQHISTMAEMDVSTPSGIYEWMESVRAVASAQAFFAHAAASQLYGAARQAARQGKEDGRMTLAEKAKLRIELMRLSRAINRGTAESFLSAAATTVKAWTQFQSFLDELQSEHVQRPHRSSKGGFDPYGGV